MQHNRCKFAIQQGIRVFAVPNIQPAALQHKWTFGRLRMRSPPMDRSSDV